jgi:hypothetical protein
MQQRHFGQCRKPIAVISAVLVFLKCVAIDTIIRIPDSASRDAGGMAGLDSVGVIPAQLETSSTKPLNL